MTFSEILTLIDFRKEVVVLDNVNLLRTDQRIYFRGVDGWEERKLPNKEEDKFVMPQKPLVFPVKSK